MANTVTRTILNNGSRTILVHVFVQSDGNEGEFVNYPLIDTGGIYSLDNPFQRGTKLAIMQLWGSLSWFDAMLSFSDLNPTPIWVLSRDTNNHVDFRHFGGLSDRWTPPQTDIPITSSEKTNRLLLSTRGFAPENSQGTIIIELKKESHST